MLLQLKAIEQTTGFLKAVELRRGWIAAVRNRAHAQEALASLQIEKGWPLVLSAKREGV